MSQLQAKQDQIAGALGTLAAQVPGLQVHSGWLDNPTPPSIDVYPSPSTFETGAGFGFGAKQVSFTVRARVAMTDPAAGQQLLLRLLDPTDPASVTVALRGTAYEPGEVSGYRQYADDNADQKMLGCEWIVSSFL